jgi:hypothetical protein
MFRHTFFSMVLGSLLFVSGGAAQAATFQVDYRSGTTAPWQYYTTVNTQADADQVVASLQESGFQALVTPIAAPGAYSYNLNYAAPVVGSGFYDTYYVNPGYRGWHYGWRHDGYGWHGGWHGGHHWGHHGVHHHAAHHVHHAHHAHHAHHGGHHGGHHR